MFLGNSTFSSSPLSASPRSANLVAEIKRCRSYFQCCTLWL